VASHEGFKFVNEGKAGKPKWGYVSTTPGSKLRIHINTTMHNSSMEERPEVVVYIVSGACHYFEMQRSRLICWRPAL
jgi:hypothetical protein